MNQARLIAVDWGTTSLRCYVVSETGEIVARHESGDGILAVTDGDFAGVLARVMGSLPVIDPSLPVVMSGMIGSRQGWVEAAYVRCPAGLTDLAVKLSHLESPLEHEVFLVPGIDTRNANGVPDVMRGRRRRYLARLPRIRSTAACSCCLEPTRNG